MGGSHWLQAVVNTMLLRQGRGFPSLKAGGKFVREKCPPFVELILVFLLPEDSLSCNEEYVHDSSPFWAT